MLSCAFTSDYSEQETIPVRLKLIYIYFNSVVGEEFVYLGTFRGNVKKQTNKHSQNNQTKQNKQTETKQKNPNPAAVWH